MLARTLLIPAAGAAAASSLPFADATCWQEAAAITRVLQTMRGKEDHLINTQPNEKAACSAFTYNERQIVAITLMQCRLNERHGLPTRETGTVSASELAPASSTPFASCIDPTKISLAEFDDEVERQVSACFKAMDNYTYHLYVEHMNHVENLCFHVHAILWQQNTESLLRNLSESAADVTKKLQESSIKFAQLSTKQEASLHLQERILRNGQDLHNIVENGNNRVQSAFDSMRAQVELEHEKVLNLFSDIFQGVNKLTAFQQFLKMKVLDVQAVAVYGFMIFLTYHMTSTVKTQNARAPLIAIWTGGLLVELVVGRFMNDESMEYQQRLLVTMSRYGLSLVGLFIWLRCYILYEDPYSRVLNEVQSQMFVLEHKMDRCLKRASTLPAVDTAVVRRTRKD